MSEDNKEVTFGVIEVNRCLWALIHKNKFDIDFYKFCAVKIKKYIYRQFGNRVPLEETAYDIIHKQIFEKKPTCVVGSPSKWLWRITRNYCLNQILSNNRYARLIENMKEQPYYEDSLEKEELKLALRKLDEISLKVIVLHYFHKFTYAEIAGILGISEPNARKISSRAKVRLKELLTDV